MTQRIPLIVNPGAAQIQELAATDDLVVAANIYTGGILTDNYYYANGQPFAGGGNSTYSNANVQAYLEAGSIGNIIPAVANTLSLGNSTRQWKDLYVSNATIYLNNIPLAGNSTTVTYANVPLISSNGISPITTTANVTGGNLGILPGGVLRFGDGTTQSTAGAQGDLLISGSSGFKLEADGTLSALTGEPGSPTPTNFVANTTTPDFQFLNSSDTGLFTQGDEFTLTSGGVYAWQFDNTGGLTAPGAIAAAGNISAGNVTATGNVTASGNLVAPTVQTNLVKAPSVTIQSTQAGAGIALVPGTGGNINASTAVINNIGTPVQANDAATKAYVDGIASGLQIKQAVKCATTTSLPTNLYVNGASGVGATLTGTGTGALVIDGYTVQLNDRVLVKDEITQSHNGIYTLTRLGTSFITYVLTRANDFNQPAEVYGAYTFDQNSNTSWVCLNTSTPPTVIGTTAITFSEFSTPTQYVAGTALSLAGQTFNVNTDNLTVSVNGSNQLQVKPSAQLVTPNIGTATGTSLTLAASASIGANLGVAGNITAANANITGTLRAGNLVSTVSNLGNVGNITIGGGASGYILSTNGSGALTWVSPASGTGLANGTSNIQVLNSGAINMSATGVANVLSVAATGITVTGNSNLGGNGNVTITGGITGQVLTTDGSGVLSWTTVSVSPDEIVSGTSNVLVYPSGNVATTVAGNANVFVVTGTGANIAGTANITGNTSLTNVAVSGQSSLGPVANVHITGGANGQVLTTDGSGSLSWVSAGVIPIPAVYFAAVANGNNQTFTDAVLSSYTSNTDMTVFFNGSFIESDYYTLSGDTLTILFPLSIGDSIDVAQQFVSAANIVTSYANANANAFLSSGLVGDIIPNGNNAQSLGNATNQWSDLWVANATIYFDGTPLSADGTGNLTFDGNSLVTIDNTTPGVLAIDEVDANAVYVGNMLGDPGDPYFYANATGSEMGLVGAGGISVTGGGISIGGTGGANIFGIMGANILIGGQYTGNIVVGSPLVSNSSVTAASFTGDGSGLTGITATTSELSNGAFTVSLDSTGVLTLADGSTLNGSTLKSTSGGYAEIANFNEQQIMWVDDVAAYIATNYGIANFERQWTFGVNGTTTFPDGTVLNGSTLTAAPGGDAALTDSTSNSWVWANATGAYIGTQFAAGPAYQWTFDGTGALVYPDGTTTTGASVTTPVEDSYDITTSMISSVSADAIAGSGSDVFIADIEFNDDITVVQPGWQINAGTPSAPIWIDVTAVDSSVLNQYSITAPGFTFVQGDNYTFSDPVPVTNTWSFGNNGYLTLPGSGTISQVDNDLFIEVAGTDIIGLRTDGGDVIVDAAGNLNIPGQLISTTSVSRLSLNENGVGSAYLTSTDNDTTAVLLSTTGIQEYAGVSVDIVAGTLLPGLETDYVDSRIILEDLFTQNELEPGYPWGITLPVSYLTYNQLILLASDTFPNQTACTVQAYNTQNTYELWQGTLADTQVMITVNEQEWSFSSDGNLTVPADSSIISSSNVTVSANTLAATGNITANGTIRTQGIMIANTVILANGVSTAMVVQSAEANYASLATQTLMTIPDTNVAHIDYNVTATDAAGATRQVSKIMAVIYDGNVNYNEYGSLAVGANTPVSDITVAIVSSNVVLQATGSTANTISYNVVATAYY